MIIDFHTHIFPDKIAERTISMLSETGGIPAHSDGTPNGLINKMQAAGVDIAVSLPVLTSPLQFDSVNRFAKEINDFFADKDTRIISFAGIHPDCEDIGGKMKIIKDSGFIGIKIHPDYQKTFIDDEKYVKIMEYAKEYDLIVVTHAGVDGAFRNIVRCPPSRALNLIRRVPHSKLVLAHLGANEMISDVIDTLCGEDVYLDTSYVLRFTEQKDFETILKRHGADRILFASDSPWSDIKGDVDIIRSFGLDAETNKKIFCENAKELLRI